MEAKEEAEGKAEGKEAKGKAVEEKGAKGGGENLPGTHSPVVSGCSPEGNAFRIARAEAAALEAQGKKKKTHKPKKGREEKEVERDVAIKAMIVDEDVVYTAGDDKHILVWDRQTLKLCECADTKPAILTGHDNWILCLALNEGRLYSGALDGSIFLWGDWKTREILHKFNEHENGIQSLFFYKEQMVSVSMDATVRCWPAVGGKSLAILRGHTNLIEEAVLLRSELYTASWDKTVRAWDLSLQKPVERPEKDDYFEFEMVYYGHKKKVRSLAVRDYELMKSDILYSGSDDCTIRSFECKTGTRLQVLRGHSSPVTMLLVQMNVVFSVSLANEIRLWDTNKKPAVTTRTLGGLHGTDGHNHGPTCMKLWIRDKRGQHLLYTGARDSTVRAWQLVVPNEVGQETGTMVVKRSPYAEWDFPKLKEECDRRSVRIYPMDGLVELMMKLDEEDEQVSGLLIASIDSLDEVSGLLIASIDSLDEVSTVDSTVQSLVYYVVIQMGTLQCIYIYTDLSLPLSALVHPPTQVLKFQEEDRIERVAEIEKELGWGRKYKVKSHHIQYNCTGGVTCMALTADDYVFAGCSDGSVHKFGACCDEELDRHAAYIRRGYASGQHGIVLEGANEPGFEEQLELDELRKKLLKKRQKKKLRNPDFDFDGDGFDSSSDEDENDSDDDDDDDGA
jgi:WD40 repeat protein